jgi:NADH pyrophosphatase NudC (nudix superfamily)
MSGSPAEERIRAKAEAALREVWPSGRIVHELVVVQGGCRLDLAAVTPDRLIIVEIKSERDVLTRLKEQREQALRVADGFCVALAEKHWRKAWEDRHVSILDAAKEEEIAVHLRQGQRDVHAATTNSPARLNMLWASELRLVAATGDRATRRFSIIKASDEFSGAEVRRRVCAALRARHFPRADPPVLSELFPAPTKGDLA